MSGNIPALPSMFSFGTQGQTYICKYVKVKVKLTLEEGTKVQRWSRGIAVLFLLTSAPRWGWVVKTTPRPL
jgi:hypothetical protein